MRIILDPIETETMKKIDAHCKANGGTRETFAVAALKAAVDNLKVKPAEEESADEKADDAPAAAPVAAAKAGAKSTK